MRLLPFFFLLGCPPPVANFIATKDDTGLDSEAVDSENPDSTPDSKDDSDTDNLPTDEDGDGYFTPEDCDDDNPDIHPGVSEVCDGADQDCDGQVDNEATDAQSCYLDADGDGHGTFADVVASCTCDAGRSLLQDDCDDDEATNYPGNTEACDAEDNDCDGYADEELTLPTWYLDTDGDGYGLPGSGVPNCTAPTGYVADGNDCDDRAATAFPGAATAEPSVCTRDRDGDGWGDDGLNGTDCDDRDATVAPGTATAEPAVCTRDADADGWGDLAINGSDCLDSDPQVSPDAPEIWYDGVDGNCDGGDDYDGDEDGYRSEQYGGDDCDDQAATTYPGAVDIPYDGVDSDCSGSDQQNDLDNDGFYDWGTTQVDCDDTDSSIYPGAPDAWYDGVDADCAGDSDFDADGDGYDSDTYGGDDCDDLDSQIFPGAADLVYDGIDANCAGDSDYDADGDGYDSDLYGGDDCDDTDPAYSPAAVDVPYDGIDDDCSGGSDYDADGDSHDAIAYGGQDCDDADSAIAPGATDTPYDGIDADCAGDSDFDADQDGHDAIAFGGQDCDDGAANVYPGAFDRSYDGIDADCAGDSDYDADADGYEDPRGGGGDCDDSDPSIHPGATEVCEDGLDNDCDGSANGCALPAQTVLNSAVTAVHGAQALDYAGSSVAFVPDLNGDGKDEVLVGASGANGQLGSAYLLNGGFQSGSLANADRTWAGVVQETGYCVEAVQDSVDTWLIVGSNTDGVFVLSGSAGTDFIDNAATAYLYNTGGSPGCVATGGDFDDDGTLDLVVGATGDNANGSASGRLWVDINLAAGNNDLGNVAVDIYGEGALDRAGVGHAGDLTGDGLDDLLVGAWRAEEPLLGRSTGAVYLVENSTLLSVIGSMPLNYADAKYYGNTSDLSLGFSLEHGDFDGDGYQDLIMGAPNSNRYNSSGGLVYMAYGPLSTSSTQSAANQGQTFYGLSSSNFGYSLAVGDPNGDGVDDLLVGSVVADIFGYTDNGAAALYYGPFPGGACAVGTCSDVVFGGGSSNDEAGRSLAMDGDADGDGYDDILIGGERAMLSAGAAWFIPASSAR